jgi:hypothetical protein
MTAPRCAKPCAIPPIDDKWRVVCSNLKRGRPPRLASPNSLPKLDVRVADPSSRRAFGARVSSPSPIRSDPRNHENRGLISVGSPEPDCCCRRARSGAANSARHSVTSPCVSHKPSRAWRALTPRGPIPVSRIRPHSPAGGIALSLDCYKNNAWRMRKRSGKTKQKSMRR